ncbi:TonB-dependent receptor [Chitinophaga cymbidii]|uniref:Ferrichrome-iron receptor n=1 Tax=Chitinophaga cymbidii TaxID=1096750 RepID=A0A512RT99_9BACT|nr:TonB-dependent receptor [Chitinophaga cymbidii]GEP98926.1 ferrichrome-iron receptor [Chitinophaga cymbidii]
MQLKLLAFFFGIFISASIPSTVFGQDRPGIAGMIRNEAGQPVPHASVSINNQTVISSASGSFTIPALPPGNYKVRVSSVGYQPKEISVTVTTGQSELPVITLTSSVGELQTVEITGRRDDGYKASYSFAATKIAIPVTEIPSTVSTITQELIRDRQAVRFDDVARNTNVRVTNNGRSVIIRGFVSTNRLINGLRTLTDNYRFAAISPVVESYEVIKGPSSSMFGNMSPGGVINIVTKKPLAQKKQQVSFSTGSFNTVRGDLDFTGKVTEDGTVLYRINAFGQLSDTWYQNMKDDAFTLAPSFSFLPREGTRINVDVNYTRLITLENDGLFPFKGKSIDETPIDFTVFQPGDRNKTTTTSINFSLSQRITKNIHFNLSYLKDFLKWDDRRHSAEIYLGDAAWSDGDSSISVSYWEWESKMDADNATGYLTADFNTGSLGHKALIGYDYNVSLFNWGTYRYNNAPIGKVNVYDPTKSTNLDGAVYDLATVNYSLANRTRDYANGIYFQDQVSIGERLKVLLGLRYEDYTFRLAYKTPTEDKVSQEAWLPKIGITYNFPSNTHVYGSYITGFQPVSSGSLIYGTVEGGGELKPEYSNQFEFGAKQELFNKNLLLTAAWYQIKKINVTQLTNPTVADPNDRIWRQLGEVTSTGFEVEFNGRIGPSFSVNGAYNYNDARITGDIDPAKINEKLGLAPLHQGNIWAKYEILNNGLLDGLGFGAGMNLSSKTPMLQAPAQTTPGYTVADAAIFYKVNRVSLSLNVNNVFNKRYYTGAVRERERYYTGAPRNLMLRVGYSL